MTTYRQYTFKYTLSGMDEEYKVMAQDELMALLKFYDMAKGWSDFEINGIEVSDGKYAKDMVTLVDEKLDGQTKRFLRQPNCSTGKYYAFSFDESRRVEKCLDEDIPIGRVALFPVESDEFPDNGWLVYDPWGFSTDSKRYTSYREAVEDFLEAEYKHWYEKVHNL